MPKPEPDTYAIAKPVEETPEVVDAKAPPTGRKFPCPACGARLDYNPSARGLHCPYCGYDEVIEKGDKGDIQEKDYLEYLSREEGKGKAIPGRSSETQCTGCGAVVLLEDNVATDKCPFCTTHLETKPEAAHAMVPPESVLPFTRDLKNARESFEKWISGLWFAPSELKQLANLGQLSGVYVPYWTYDAMTYTFYEGERGDNYTDVETFIETLSDGRRESRTRNVVRVRWSYAQGEVKHFFDDVLICGSNSIRKDLLDGVGPWDLGKLEPFEPAYLSGFKAERYSVGLKEGLDKAKKEMDGTIHRLCCRDIGGDQQRVHERKTRYSGITFKHTLLPVWLAVYRYRDKTYQILVNGRNGRITGDRPYSTMKIARLVIAVILALILVFVLFSQFSKRSANPRPAVSPKRSALVQPDLLAFKPGLPTAPWA